MGVLSFTHAIVLPIINMAMWLVSFNQTLDCLCETLSETLVGVSERQPSYHVADIMGRFKM